MLPVKADLAICSPVIGVSEQSWNMAFMLSYKLDFSSCVIMPGFGKSSHKSSLTRIFSVHLCQKLIHYFLTVCRIFSAHLCQNFIPCFLTSWSTVD